jgi:hypothetical protein
LEVVGWTIVNNQQQPATPQVSAGTVRIPTDKVDRATRSGRRFERQRCGTCRVTSHGMVTGHSGKTETEPHDLLYQNMRHLFENQPHVPKRLRNDQPNTPHYLHFVGFHDTISQPPIKKKTPATQAHAFSTSFSSASRLPLSGHFVRHQLPVGRTQGPGLRRFRRQNGCCHIRLQPGAANDRWPWGVHGIAGGEPKKPGIKGRNTKKHIYEVSCWILWTICPKKN